MKKKPVILLLTAALSAFLSITSLAAKAPSVDKSRVVYFSKGQYEDVKGDQINDHDGLFFIKDLDKSAKIISLKSSNKNLNPQPYYAGRGYFKKNNQYVWEDGTLVGFNVQVTDFDDNTFRLKEGDKATITTKIRQNGKVYTLKTKLMLKLLPNICAKLKIGKKNYAKYFDGWTERQVAPYITGKQKVFVKVAKPYRLMSLEVCYKGKSDLKKVKNNTVLDFSKIDQFRVTVKYKNQIPNMPKSMLHTSQGESCVISGITVYNSGSAEEGE